MKFVKLTLDNGAAAYFGENVIVLLPPASAPTWAKTRVIVGGTTFDVDEDLDDVLDKFRNRDE